MSQRERDAFIVALMLGADVTTATHYYMGESRRGVMLFKCKTTGYVTKVTA
jgi:hypothetical protein